jgi:hypothetical protein
MDAAGAAALSARIEQHQHWLQAGTVRDGIQDSHDPHAYCLIELQEGLRIYADDSGPFFKRLTNDTWLLEAGRAASAA